MVTGDAGFIGGRLVDRLLAGGEPDTVKQTGCLG